VARRSPSSPAGRPLAGPTKIDMRFAFALYLAVWAAAPAAAQPAALSGPTEGFTFDAPTRSLRAVAGYPGASSFGPALVSGIDIAAVAPQRNYAVAFQNGGCVFVSSLDGKAAVTPISEVSLQPEHIVWSADGSMAVLYSLSASWFQPLTGFPQTPSAQPRVDATRLGGSLASIAIDPKGQRIAVGVSGSAGEIYWTSDRQSFQPMLAMNHPIALTFSADGTAVYALDGDSQRITSAGIVNPGVQTFPTGLADPVAMQSVQTAAGELLYVAARKDQLLRIFKPVSRQIVADVPLSFHPSRLDPLGASFVLAARSQAATPLWVYSGTPVPGAFFVPAIPAAPGSVLGVGGTE